MNPRKHLAVACLLAPLVAYCPAGAVTIFSDNFSGGASGLDGTTPTITTGAAAWVAETGFKANGSVSGGGPGSATLGFTPVNGLVYTLDVSFGPSSYPGGQDNDWFAVGFANGQNNSTSNNSRFVNANVIGSPWMLQRGPNGGVNRTWLGTSTSGTQNGLDWSDQTGLVGGNSDLRIVLDTTGGAGNWNATFYAKSSADSGYSVVRATETLASETVNSVGIARSSGDIIGSISSFSLTSMRAVPEPSSAALLGLGCLLLARRSRN